MTAAYDAYGGEPLRQLIDRWALAAMFVVAVHGGVALAMVNWPEPKKTAGEPPAAVMIELAPLPVAPETPPQELAVGVQQTMTVESTPTEPEEAPLDELQPQPEAVKKPPEELLDEQSELEIETESEAPELPQIETAAAVLQAQTMPLPQPKEIEEEEEPEEPKKKTKPKPKVKSSAQVTSAPKPVNSTRARTNAAPTSGTASSKSIATWRGSVIAHLNRHKRYPGSGRGTATVAFSIDRSGRVLSARLVRSSGSAILDKEAVALARRASPVPTPPSNIGRSKIVLAVPVRFSR